VAPAVLFVNTKRENIFCIEYFTSKLKLYWSVIRLVAVYGCDTWALKGKTIQKLSVFERKILRKIFGRTKEDNANWRIKTNIELDELIKHWNIINCVFFSNASTCPARTLLVSSPPSPAVVVV
jgi:hypothetical protein